MKISSEVQAECLAIVLGNKNVPEKCNESNKELFKALLAVGFATFDKKGGNSIVFKSSNLLSGLNVLDQEDIETWKAMDFTKDFILGKSLKCIITKCVGDTYATIGDSDGKHNFGCYVVAQDSRSPWVLLSNDNRPFELVFTNKNMPDESGRSIPCTGWKKKMVGNHTKWLYNSEVTVSDCNKGLKWIMKSYFGKRYDHLQSAANSVERSNFIRSDNMVSENLEIVKSRGETSGSIYLNQMEIGKVVLTDISVGNSKFTIQMDNDVEDRYSVQDKIWSILTPPKKTNSFGTNVGAEIEKTKKGKKQFALKK